MSTEEKILRRIANTLIMYSYHMTENGLLHGKTGAMLYLYLYAQHSGDEVCYDYAGELLDGLMKSASDAPSDFEDGAAGLGWCVTRLLRADIVGGRPNGVLAGIDNRILEMMSRNMWSKSWNELIYCAGRLADFKTEGSKGYSELILSFLEWQIKEKQQKLSDNRKRAVSHYLDSYDIAFGKSIRTDALRKLLDLSHVDTVWKPDEESTVTSDDIDDNRIKRYITSSIWSMISGKLVSDTGPGIDELLDYVKRQQLGLSPDDLRLSDGLAGLGSILLNKEFTNYQNI